MSREAPSQADIELLYCYLINLYHDAMLVMWTAIVGLAVVVVVQLTVLLLVLAGMTDLLAGLPLLLAMCAAGLAATHVVPRKLARRSLLRVLTRSGKR